MYALAQAPVRWLMAAIVLGALASSAAACQYCRMAGDPLSGLDFTTTPDRSGAVQLDAAIDKFQAAPVQAPALAIVTNAAELPARAKRRPVVAAVVPAPASPRQTHALDGGLIGLAVAGGVFCWRTRRPDKDVAEHR